MLSIGVDAHKSVHVGGVTESDRADAILRRGRARIKAGDLERGVADCQLVLELANRCDLTGLRADAVLGWAEGSAVRGREPELRVALEHVLADDVEDLAVRAHLKARLAQVLYYEDAHDRWLQLSRGAVDDAQHRGRPHILASVLATTHAALWEPADLEQRTRVAQQIVTVAAATAPSLSIRPDTGPREGASGTATTAWYTILLSNASSVSVGVDFHTESGTASGCASRVDGCDFQHVSGRLTFQPGETSKRVAIPVWGDDTPEDHETLLLLLSNASNATIAMVEGITDIDNDDTPILNIRPRTGPREGPAGEVTNAVFDVVLMGADREYARSLVNVTVDFYSRNDFATGCLTLGPGCDFQLIRGSLTYIPGEVTKTVSVPVLGDNVPEHHESFALCLSNEVNATVSPRCGLTAIYNDDF
jgi:Calx-beta domain